MSGSREGLRHATRRCLIGTDNGTAVRIAIIVRQLKQFKKCQKNPLVEREKRKEKISETRNGNKYLQVYIKGSYKTGFMKNTRKVSQ